MLSDDQIDAHLQRVRNTLASFKSDHRLRDLFIWGAHTDRRTEPCACCGTPIALLETSGSDFPTTGKRWVEIIQDNGPDITDLVFRHHNPARCRSLRKQRRNHGLT